MIGPMRPRLSAWLLGAAAARVGSTRADWAAAMIAEAKQCASDGEQLRWAWGCWIASLRAPPGPSQVFYAIALGAGLALMAVYEWSADEGIATIVILGLLSSLLGMLRPRHALLSGALVGLVVTCVIAFEALSGLQPTYETRVQTLAHSLHWLILLVPALLSAELGAELGRRLPVSRTSR